MLLDTHALVWWLRDGPQMSASLREQLASDNQTVFVGPVSAFEITTKVRLGKFEEAVEIAGRFDELVDVERFERLSLTETHALLAGRLAGEHRDPFDRLLAAREICEDLILVTRDPAFTGFGVRTLS